MKKAKIIFSFTFIAVLISITLAFMVSAENISDKGNGNPENMTDEEKFAYFTESMVDMNNTVVTRKNAYDSATELIVKYYDFDKKEYKTTDESVKTAVNAYLNYDYPKLLSEFSEYNLVEFDKKVTEFSKIKRQSNTYQKRKQLALEIDDFLSENNGFILQNEKYNECMKVVTRANSEILEEDKIEEFNIAISHFDTSVSVSAKQKYYNKAKVVYEKGIDTSLLENAGFEEFTNCYYRYLEAGYTLKYLVYDENSRKIISCIDLFKEYDTEQEWIENHDYVEKYVLIARKMIAEKNYNPDYEGFPEAFAIYEKVNAYFYNELQQEHIGVISSLLEKFENSKEYIERLGICSKIDVYLKDNDIDRNNKDVVNLLNKHEENKSKLIAEEDKHREALRENTTLFIQVIEKLKNCNGYKETKKAFEEAEVYYFAMNVGSDAAKESIEIFELTKEKLDNIELMSEKFLETVALMNNASNDKTFELLVEGYGYRSEVSSEYDGIEKALAEYQEKYDGYTKNVNEVNREIETTVNVVGSLRDCVEGERVFSHILSKFYK